MSGHPQGGQYDDGYGHQGQAQPHGQDSYYHDDQQYGQYHDDARGQQGQYQQNGNDAYYDEQYVSPLFKLLTTTKTNIDTGPIMTASRAATTSRTAVATTTTNTASNRVTRMNTTTTSITTKVVLRMATHRTPRAASPDAASTILRKIPRPSVTSQ
jgi:hypothetical protein